MPTHDFKCPDCGRHCQLIEGVAGDRSSMRHELPECNTYKRTKRDGQKFLELAWIARNGSAATLVKP